MSSTDTAQRAVIRPDWLTTEVWPHEVRTATVAGNPVAYTDEGQGPTLLLVHDGMWSYIWGQLIDRLKADFRVVTLDFPGSGLSPAVGSEPASLQRDADLLEEFVSTIGLDRFTLVLHDLGGGVGFHLTTRIPEQVVGTVFMNTFVWPPEGRGLRTMFAAMTSGAVTRFNVATNLIPRLTSGPGGIGRHLDGPARSAFVNGFNDRSARLRFHQLMASVKGDGSQVLGDTRSMLDSGFEGKPALTIYGEKNDQFGFQARIREALPQVEEMVVAKGNHFPMCDDPDGVANRIGAWHRRHLS